MAPLHRETFERVYAGDGDWALLFAKADGFLGTELLIDAERPGRYVTIDRWQTTEAFAAFKTNYTEAYDALDKTCEGLTIHEIRIGAFEAWLNPTSQNAN